MSRCRRARLGVGYFWLGQGVRFGLRLDVGRHAYALMGWVGVSTPRHQCGCLGVKVRIGEWWVFMSYAYAWDVTPRH
ncbi:hypothetical protein PIB30_068947 [Stylosanthes scabra]|uniref:Uncharacterized protein n=1 Tax=Stylosanthes scabra TaxID=79078 RepID=A0ABU6YLY7_9FABA|nr:hypothetical protein [Stylosanthes scabra]